VRAAWFRSVNDGARTAGASKQTAYKQALGAGGARRILNDTFFFSAPQLKRDPLDGADGRTTLLSRLAVPLLIVCALDVGCTRPRTATQPRENAALQQAAVAWANSFATRDPATIATYFSENAVAWFPHGETPTVGRAAIQEAWVNYFKHTPAHPVSIDSVVTAGSGELGLVYGKYLYKPRSDPTANGGRYVAIWRPTIAGWQLVLLSAHQHGDVSAATFSTP